MCAFEPRLKRRRVCLKRRVCVWDVVFTFCVFQGRGLHEELLKLVLPLGEYCKDAILGLCEVIKPFNKLADSVNHKHIRTVGGLAELFNSEKTPVKAGSGRRPGQYTTKSNAYIIGWRLKGEPFYFTHSSAFSRCVLTCSRITFRPVVRRQHSCGCCAGREDKREVGQQRDKKSKEVRWKEPQQREKREPR